MNECASEAYELQGNENEKPLKETNPLRFSMQTILNTSLESLKAQNEMMLRRGRED
jgi:hypothetical protein